MAVVEQLVPTANKVPIRVVRVASEVVVVVVVAEVHATDVAKVAQDLNLLLRPRNSPGTSWVKSVSLKNFVVRSLP